MKASCNPHQGELLRVCEYLHMPSESQAGKCRPSPSDGVPSSFDTQEVMAELVCCHLSLFCPQQLTISPTLNSPRLFWNKFAGRFPLKMKPSEHTWDSVSFVSPQTLFLPLPFSVSICPPSVAGRVMASGENHVLTPGT